MYDSKFLGWMIWKIIGRQSAFSPEQIQVPKACNRVCWVLLHSSSMCKSTLWCPINDYVRVHACMLLTLEVRFQVFGCAFHLLVKTFKFLRLVTEFCWVLRHSCSMSKLHCGVRLANSVLVQCLYVARS